jgi:hypothetical protein
MNLPLAALYGPSGSFFLYDEYTFQGVFWKKNYLDRSANERQEKCQGIHVTEDISSFTCWEPMGI